MLCIQGQPGCGKSTLIDFLVKRERKQVGQQQLLEQDSNVVLSFFHSDGDLKSEDMGRLLYQSPLHQLLSQNGSLVSHLKESMNFCNRVSKESGLDRVWHGQEVRLQEQYRDLLAMISKEGKRVLIFLDKLDELYDVERNRAKEVIRWFYQICTDTNHLVSVCFASTDFMPAAVFNDFLIKPENENHDAIRLYLDGKLGPYSTLRSEEDIALIKSVLCEKTSGIFQWLVCNLDEIQNMIYDNESAEEIILAVVSLPKSLELTYESLMQKIIHRGDNIDFTCRALQWITLAREPLPINDLKYAICSDPSASVEISTSGQEAPEWCSDNFRFMNKLRRLCRCFLILTAAESVQTESYDSRHGQPSLRIEEFETQTPCIYQNVKPGQYTVRFNHESVYNFMAQGGLQMLQRRKSGDTVRIAIGQMQLSIAKLCLRHLLSEHVRKFVEDRTVTGKEALELWGLGFPSADDINAPTFTMYAAKHWRKHFSMAEDGNASDIELIKLIVQPSEEDWGWIMRASLVATTSYALKTYQWSTPMHVMSMFGFFKTMNAILSDISENCTDNNNQIKRIRQHCLSLIHHVDCTFSTPLLIAAGKHDPQIVELLIRNGADIKVRHPQTNFTVLHVTTLPTDTTCLPVIRALLSHGPKLVDIKDSDGHTPLSRAAHHGRIDLVLLFLPHTKLGVHSKNLSPKILVWPRKKGLPIGTPLFIMWYDMSSQSVEALKLLLRSPGIDGKLRDEDGRSLLHQISNRSYRRGYGTCYNEKARLLISSGKLDLNLKDKEGFTPFSYAVWLGNLEIVKMFLETNGVDYEQPIKQSGCTPFLFAVLCKEAGMVQTMLDSGKVNIEARTSDGLTPYLLAAQGNEDRVDVLSTLLKSRKIDHTAVDKHGRPALIQAIFDGKPANVRLLLDAGGWATAKDLCGISEIWMLAKTLQAVWDSEESRRIYGMLLEYDDEYAGRLLMAFPNDLVRANLGRRFCESYRRRLTNQEDGNYAG